MRQRIPAPVIAVVADAASDRETHATLDSLFMYSGAPGDPPAGSKNAKAMEWLRIVNKDDSVEPLVVLGQLLEGYLDAEPDSDFTEWDEKCKKSNERIRSALAKANLRYVTGGHVVGSAGIPTITLEQHIRKRNIESVSIEFERAVQNIDSKPREALSAACNILESIFKVYIEDNDLDMPKKKDLKPTWAVVRDDLNFDPGKVEDRDLKEILSGLASVVGGVGALRTHASSAHGRGKITYRIQPRHARLAVHAAHTLGLFVLESWSKKSA